MFCKIYVEVEIMTLLFLRDLSSRGRKFIKESLSEQNEDSVYHIEEGDISLAPVPAESVSMIFTFLRDLSPEMEKYLSENLHHGLAGTN